MLIYRLIGILEASTSTFPFITCARCNKPVDRVDVMIHPATLTRHYAVFCHGEVDRADIPYSELVWGQAKIVEAVAFREYQKAIAPVTRSA